MSSKERIKVHFHWFQIEKVRGSCVKLISELIESAINFLTIYHRAVYLCLARGVNIFFPFIWYLSEILRLVWDYVVQFCSVIREDGNCWTNKKKRDWPWMIKFLHGKRIIRWCIFGTEKYYLFTWLSYRQLFPFLLFLSRVFFSAC